MESMTKQLPQVDLTFGIGDIVGSIALIASAFTFYISYTQASQSEQIRTVREIWLGIIEGGRIDKIEEEVKVAKENKKAISNASLSDINIAFQKWSILRILL